MLLKALSRSVKAKGSVFSCLIFLAGLVFTSSAASASDFHTWIPLEDNPIIIEYRDNFNVFTAGTIRMENGVYKVWGGDTHLQYSTSVDGVTWSQPVLLPGLGVGASGSFDQTSLFGAAVIYSESLNMYQMWYTGQKLAGFSDFRIGYAISPDGISWTKVPGPGTGGSVIDKGMLPGEGEKVQQPVVLLEGSVYKMWYHGSDPPGSNESGIFYAESNDGINWTKLGKVIDRGPSGAFDFGGTYPRTIIKSDEEYQLWYDIDNDQSRIYNTAYATSADGLNWTKHGLIPFPAEPWCTALPPFCGPRFFHVVADGSTLEVWYTRTSHMLDIGFATTMVSGQCVDNDGDGYGSPGDDSCDCDCTDTDCDDDNTFIFPGATEDCNGVDDNCDLDIDEGFDQDGDGYTSCGGDCDDDNPSINPSAEEVCDGVDNNCGGGIDEGFDRDGDSVADCFDNCPYVPNDQTDSDEDGAGDACDVCPYDPYDDGDGDGVCGDVDVCAGTVIPEAVPLVKLNPNHWALTDADTTFDTVKRGSSYGSGRSYFTTDTGGCSCEQIIDALGLGDGHRKYGCSNSAMDDWIAHLP